MNKRDEIKVTRLTQHDDSLWCFEVFHGYSLHVVKHHSTQLMIRSVKIRAAFGMLEDPFWGLSKLLNRNKRKKEMETKVKTRVWKATGRKPLFSCSELVVFTSATWNCWNWILATTKCSNKFMRTQFGRNVFYYCGEMENNKLLTNWSHISRNITFPD